MAYGLSHSYFGANFISDFNFINYVDPSNGFVRYVRDLLRHWAHAHAKGRG